MKDSEVIKLILDAQKFNTMAKEVSRHYYDDKDRCIRRALGILKHTKRSRISFKVTFDPVVKLDLVYFEFILKGVRYQFSFHSPRKQKHCGDKKIEWDKVPCINSYLDIRKELVLFSY